MYILVQKITNYSFYYVYFHFFPREKASNFISKNKITYIDFGGIPVEKIAQKCPRETNLQQLKGNSTRVCQFSIKN
jgi:hypothetical protein